MTAFECDVAFTGRNSFSFIGLWNHFSFLFELCLRIKYSDNILNNFHFLKYELIYKVNKYYKFFVENDFIANFERFLSFKSQIIVLVVLWQQQFQPRFSFFKHCVCRK